MSGPELEQTAKRQRRLGKVAFSVLGLAMALFLLATFTLVDQISQNSRDNEQDTIIRKVQEADPCTNQPVNVEGCRQFLRGLAAVDIFPRELVCFIIHRAGFSSPDCRGRGKTPQADPARSPAGPGASSAPGAGGSGTPANPVPGTSRSGGSTTSPPASPPSPGTPTPPAPPPAGPPGSPGPPGPPGPSGPPQGLPLPNLPDLPNAGGAACSAAPQLC